MRTLSEEEKARLQAKIEEERTGNIDQPKKEARSPWMNTALLVVGVVLLGLFITLLEGTTGAGIPLRAKWGVILLSMTVYVIIKIGRKDRAE
jgi:hypothetical protein